MATEASIKEQLRPMANLLKERLPAECGYALFLLHTGGMRGSTVYLSSAQRNDMLKLLREFLGHIEQAPPAAATVSRRAVLRDDQSAATRAFRESMQEPFKRMHRIIRLHTPDGTEYALILFEYGGDGLAWITSVDRGEMLREVRTWLEYAEQRQRAKS